MDYLVEVPARYLKTVIVRDCRSAAEAKRKLREGTRCHETGSIEAVGVTYCGPIYWSRAGAYPMERKEKK